MKDAATPTFTNEAFRHALEMLHYAVFIHDEELIRYANPAGSRLLRAQAECDVVGRPFVDFVHADCREAGRERRHVISNGGTLHGLPMKLIAVDGTVLYVRGDGAPLSVGDTTYTLIAVWPDSLVPNA